MNSLIFDRTNADVIYAKEHQSNNNFLKGAYNYTDLNRIEEWCEQIATELTNAGYSLSITTKTDWDMDDFPTQAELERIRSNIAVLKSKFFATTNVPSNLNNMTYTKANDLEKVLNEIWNNLYGTENYYVHSGVARAGQNRTWQNRFRRLYQSKEYLESTGTQYIDTGIIPSNDIKILCVQSMSGSSVLNGSDASDGSRYKWGTNAEGNVYIGFGQSNVPAEVTASLSTKYTFYIENEHQTCTETETGTEVIEQTISYANYYNTSSITLFRKRQYNSVAENTGQMRIYSCKIYKGNALVRDFIPVITTEPCLLDRVNGTLYYNQGTGTFG